ncbi:MAG: hypothetical protein J6B50_04800 [Lachnospiraceae bacterium]|nr:hypothetical protein [Lachnospiraceae bacterium]
MKWWKNFWLTRKQNDRVKIQLICFLLGIFCFSLGFYYSVQLYQLLHTPVEYVLSGSESSEKLSMQIEEIEKLEYVETVSRQKEKKIDITCKTGTISLPCIEVSKEYLESAYGLTETETMKVIYLNETAYEQLRRECQSNYGASGSKDNWQAGYSMGEGEQGMAKLVVAKSLPDDSPCVFVSGTSLELKKNNSQIRVRLQYQDLEGIQIEELQEAGAMIINSEQIEKNQLLLNIQMMQARDWLIIGCICLLFTAILKKYGK